MPELPHISGDEAIKIFQKLGFSQVRQKGSHVVMLRGEKGCVIPKHKELALGTLRSAIKQAGISVDEFIATYGEK
jgi:predicted RNA binding protein YcfA (HicA-like mRNA interferase family)